jgi:hypothetical protein
VPGRTRRRSRFANPPIGHILGTKPNRPTKKIASELHKLWCAVLGWSQYNCPRAVRHNSSSRVDVADSSGRLVVSFVVVSGHFVARRQLSPRVVTAAVAVVQPHRTHPGAPAAVQPHRRPHTAFPVREDHSDGRSSGRRTGSYASKSRPGTARRRSKREKSASPSHRLGSSRPPCSGYAGRGQRAPRRPTRASWKRRTLLRTQRFGWRVHGTLLTVSRR